MLNFFSKWDSVEKKGNLLNVLQKLDPTLTLFQLSLLHFLLELWDINRTKLQFNNCLNHIEHPIYIPPCNAIKFVFIGHYFGLSGAKKWNPDFILSLRVRNFSQTCYGNQTLPTPLRLLYGSAEMGQWRERRHILDKYTVLAILL